VDDVNLSARQPGSLPVRNFTNSNKIRDYLLPFAKKAWDDLNSETGTLPYNADCYVKTWALGEGKNRPVIAADYILLDESQDTAPVFLDILKRQEHALLVLVGDSNQQIYCQPEGTRVMRTYRVSRCDYAIAEIPIEELRVGDTVMTYRQSWRLGRLSLKGSKVSAISKRYVDEHLINVEVSDCHTKYTEDHHCVVMLGQAGLGKWAVYMQEKNGYYRVGACAGVYASQGEQFGPLVRARQEGAQRLWVLRLLDSKAQALEYERKLLAVFPGRCFKSSGGDSWWEFQLPNKESACEVLETEGKSINEPLTVRQGKWLDRSRTPFVTAARNLLNGMLMLAVKNVPYDEEDRGHTVKKSQWRRISVFRKLYAGDVYSVSVDGDHTYIGDGIVTHNSWRGAVDAMSHFKEAPRLLLSQSFRFGQAVADVANSVLAGLEEPTDLVMKGLLSIPSRVVKVEQPRCYLFRTNAAAVSRLMRAKDEGKRGHLIGSTKEVVDFCKAALELQSGRATQHPELGCFENWPEVVQYSKEDEGADLRLMVKLIEEFKAERIIDALTNMPEEEEADLILSTAHRSKGREWATVKIGPDFPTANRLTDADRRLLYVACTRAIEELDITECPTFCGGYDRKWKKGGESSEWIPGIEIRYTRDMPTAEQLTAYRERPKEASASSSASTTETKPEPQYAPHNGQPVDQNETNVYVWASIDGRWCVRGPETEVGQRIVLRRRDGGNEQTVTVQKLAKQLPRGPFFYHVYENDPALPQYRRR